MSVHEMFVSWQGEGARAGALCLFVRVSKCNLWTGREQDRKSAVCRFCDTDFLGTGGTHGGYYSPQELVRKISELCAETEATAKPVRDLIFTGGEPLLQLTETHTKMLHDAGYYIAVETNGTLPAPKGIDWLCVSPKAGTALVITSGHELKVVWPQPDLDLDALRKLDFAHFSLQPMEALGDPEGSRKNLETTLAEARSRPDWRLSLQTHKWIGVR